MKFENILQRIDYYAKIKGLNDNRITTDAGLSVGLLGKSRKNKGGLYADSIEKILHAYIDLSAEWLLTGSGEMLKAEKKADTINKEATSSGNNLDLMLMLEKKDQKIIELAEEIGRLKGEVNSLKKTTTIPVYSRVAEP